MKTIALSLLLTLSFFVSQAQLSDTSYVQHIFETSAFGEERQITVQLPEQYFENPLDSFMVTFVLDGQGPHFFGMQVGNLNYLSSRLGIIPTIIVGIHTKNRWLEFTNFAREGSDNQIESKLPTLQQHFKEDIFPWVEKHFRTQPFRAIIGHSKAADFVLQTLFNGEKDMFDAYLAISPAIGYDDFQVIDNAEQLLKEKSPINKFLYCSSGGMGDREGFFYLSAQKLDVIIRENPNPTLSYHRGHFPGKDHFTTVAPAVVEGMVLLKNEHMLSLENIEKMANNHPESLAGQMDEFVKFKNRKHPFFYTPPNTYYRGIASQYFENEKYQSALALYQFADQLKSLHRWWEVFNVGMCYKNLNHSDEAKPYFDKAFLMLEEKKADYGDNYSKIVADLKKQMM